MRHNQVFWGDAAGVHSAAMVDDYQGAVTLADALSRGGFAPRGVVIVETSDRTGGKPARMSGWLGPRGGLSDADIGLA